MNQILLAVWYATVCAPLPETGPRIAEVGQRLDAKVADLLRLMSLPVPPELTEVSPASPAPQRHGLLARSAVMIRRHCGCARMRKQMVQPATSPLLKDLSEGAALGRFIRKGIRTKAG